MRPFAILLFTALASDAGVIQGVVVEHLSGVPLARTMVRLQPVEKAGGGEVRTLQVRADRSGHFEFPSVSDGLYLLVAVRANYFPAPFGQRRPNGQGVPLEVNTESKIFAELRMKRRGVLTGRVMDENGVGIEKVSVLAYRARKPPRVVAQAETDDRGIYRIIGLDPAKYWVRTVAITLDDGASLVPTFGSEAREIGDARVHEAKADVETQYADVRPEFGPVFHLGGRVLCTSPGTGAVSVTLSSETLRRRTQTNCPNGPYQFEGLAPAAYEVFATPAAPDGMESGFIELFLGRDNDGGVIQMAQNSRVLCQFGKPGGPRDSPPDSKMSGSIVARRVDLFGPDSDREITTAQTSLPAGYWEINAKPGAGQYVDSISSSWGAPRNTNARPIQWFPVFIGPRTQPTIRIAVSDQAAKIMGVVTELDKAVPGIPVFLWPLKEAARRAIGTVQSLSNTDGKFTFEGLPPGDYRLLATFDLSEVDEDALDEAKAVTIHVDVSQTATVALTAWNAQ